MQSNRMMMSPLIATGAILWIIVSLTSAAFALTCTVLNDCGKLGEKNYTGTSALTAEVITYSDYNVTFGNGRSMKGKKFAFSPDVNPSTSYLGVWRIPKGSELYFKLRNLHPSLGVNLHTHGLHVKGTGADDPTVEVMPGQEHLYHLSLGRNHAGGTNWIHSHYHGNGIANIEGGAIGMLIVEDDSQDREIPPEVRQAETFNLILQLHIPEQWDPPNYQGNFLTVNGISDNPVLQIRQYKWMRLRMLSSSVSFGEMLTSSWSLPGGVTCNVVLIAKDGIYLKEARTLQYPFTMYWTEASRSDLMVKCDGDVGQEIQITFGSMPLMRLKIASRKPNEQPDLYDIYFKPCLPDYLAMDLSQRSVVNPNDPVWLNALLTFQGFGADKALASFVVGSDILLDLSGIGHPFHIHINHFQIQEESMNGWYRKGDWHDNAQDVRVRMHLDRWTQLMLVHCHNIIHQERVNVYGMMGVIWINGTDGTDSAFGDSCSAKVALLPTTKSPTTGRPSQAPTTSYPTRSPTTSFPSHRPTKSRPTKSPSINVKCLGYTKDQCPDSHCYYQYPDDASIATATAKLTKKAAAACLTELGCRPNTPEKLFCKYKCMPLCDLDPNCETVKSKGKKKCKPKSQ